MPLKQRHAGTKVYDRLSTEEEYKDKLEVGKQTVINYVSSAKKSCARIHAPESIVRY